MTSLVADSFLRHFSPTWDENLGWENARFVVADTEMTGLDPRSDRLVSIGAIGCMGFQLHLDDVFESFMCISHNTSAVRLHGITRQLAAERGVPEPDALEAFLDYLRDGVIVGHHIRHDVDMLERACARHFGFDQLPNLVVDTMDLALRLEEMGCLPRDEYNDEPDFSLDGLCGRFAIEPHDRHTATGDAFITGQVFLKLLKSAKRGGLLRLGQLTEPYAESLEADESPVDESPAGNQC